MKNIRFVIVSLSIMVIFSGCITGHVMVVPKANFEKVDVALVEKAIRSSLLKLRWFVTKKEDGKIFAEYRRGKVFANIVIIYSESTLKIEYVKSANLRYQEKDGVKYIHGTYNRWMRNLEKQIKYRINLARMGHEEPVGKKVSLNTSA